MNHTQQSSTASPPPPPPRSPDHNPPTSTSALPLDLDAAYATAMTAANTSHRVSDAEAKSNPFMLSAAGTKELEEKKDVAEKEGRGGVVSPLEVGEIREKYEQILGFMEGEQEKERERGGGGEGA